MDDRITQSENPVSLSDEDISEIVTSIDEISEIKSLVYKTQDKARELKDKERTKVGLFKRKNSIEELQNSSIECVNILYDMTDAQEKTFKIQEAITYSSRSLFKVLVETITYNRAIIKELELKLKGAVETDISEIARKELLDVVRQLKDQEDVLKKIDKLGKMICNNESVIKDSNLRIIGLETNTIITESDISSLKQLLTICNDDIRRIGKRVDDNQLSIQDNSKNVETTSKKLLNFQQDSNKRNEHLIGKYNEGKSLYKEQSERITEIAKDCLTKMDIIESKNESEVQDVREQIKIIENTYVSASQLKLYTVVLVITLLLSLVGLFT